MGQYYKAYTKNATEEKVWSMQSTQFETTHDFEYYIGVKLMEHSWYGNTLTDAMSFYLYKNPTQLAWVGDYAREHEMHPMCWGKDEDTDFNYVPSDQRFDYHNKWLVNHTTKEAFDLTPTSNSWVVYPISVITACGNGRGGGDYRGNHKMVGAWAMHILSIEDAVPEGFTTIRNHGFQD